MLMRMFKNFHKDNRGFTLVELMVVVVIIGVLTAIAIPVYNASTAKAEKGACEANLRMIDSAIQQYKMNEGEAPENIEALGDYFLDEPKCPSGGTYDIASEGEGEGVVYYATCNKGHSYRDSGNTGTTEPTEPTDPGTDDEG